MSDSRSLQGIAAEFDGLLGRMRNTFLDSGPGANVISQYPLDIWYPEPTVANPFLHGAGDTLRFTAERAIREMSTSTASTGDRSGISLDVSKVADLLQKVTRAAVHRDLKDVAENNPELLTTPALIEFVKINSNGAITMDDVIKYVTHPPDPPDPSNGAGGSSGESADHS